MSHTALREEFCAGLTILLAITDSDRIGIKWKEKVVIAQCVSMTSKIFAGTSPIMHLSPDPTSLREGSTTPD